MPLVPLSWLRDHVAVPADYEVSQLAADLVRVGLEEEQIVAASIQGPLVVGRVLSLVPEPQKNGKTINYCRVDVGVHNDAPGEGKEPADVASRSIVCGAHNFKVGDLVAVVLPGAVLPGPFPISSRKTYGHISDGMICSERELGLGQGHEGILVLTEKYDREQIPAVGESLLELFGVEGEVLEINVTPDRGYCFSMRGVARELAHSTGFTFIDRAKDIATAAIPLAGVDAAAGQASGDSVGAGFDPGAGLAATATDPENTVGVEIDDQAPIRGNVGCDRFVTRMVKGIDPAAPTPTWMVKRLEAAGQRSISLAVDVTNYVMLDLGQPLHAYDAARLTPPIVVRRAVSGEVLTTLDDEQRTLQAEDLVIADCAGGHGKRVIGLAGVMGGASTEISAETRDVVIEAAHFDPISVARTARRHKLPSEAAKRFERGADPQLPAMASWRAAALLARYGGGELVSVGVDLDHTTAAPSITMAASYPAQLAGVEYGTAKVVALLEQIGCTVTVADEQLSVTPPSWRPDLTGPADLVEEVARLDGYDNIPARAPRVTARSNAGGELQIRRQLRLAAVNQGLSEVLSYPFIGNAHQRQAIPESDPRLDAVKLANPLVKDAPYLRTTILDTLLEIATRNVARGNETCAIVETGLIARGKGDTELELPSAASRPADDVVRAVERAVPQQHEHLAAVLGGQRPDFVLREHKRHYDWADALTVARSIAAAVGVELQVRSCEYAPYHPGRCAELLLGNNPVGHAGELHPQVVKEYGLLPRSCALELDLEPIVKRARKAGPVAVTPVSTFPVVKEDMAFVLAEDVAAGDVAQTITRALGAECESVVLFDEYRGAGLGEGKKSLAFALRLRAADRTLASKEIEALRKKIEKAVQKKHRGELRSA